MLKIFKYLKPSAKAVALIFLLLFLQAYCDLSLPSYTSDIVNVGIQQRGIPDGVPEQLSATSMEQLRLFMEQEEQEKTEAFYEQQDEQYVLKGGISDEEREDLEAIFSRPILILNFLGQDSGQLRSVKEQLGLPMEAEILGAVDQLPPEVLEGMMAEINGKIEQIPGSIVTQTAIAWLQQEYGKLGIDIDRMQIHYIIRIGLQMLGVAFLGMAAAVMVTFLSARVAAIIGHDLRNSVYRKVIGFSEGEYGEFSTASLITRSTNDIQQIQMMTVMAFRIALFAPILGFGGILKVLRTDVSMSWIIALAVALIFLLILALFVIAMPRFKTVS